MTKPILLIDGDLILYKATSAVEVDWRYDDDHHILFSNAAEAFDLFKQQIEGFQLALGAEFVRIAFTRGQSFRNDVYPQYKAPRLGNRKPLAFADVRERAEREYHCAHVPGLEADDVLGIWATNDKFKDAIIVSEDKDLKTIPCRLYRQNELIEIGEDEAFYNFMFQTLAGDTTDGYSGCPGVGPVKAEKVLAAAYEKASEADEDELEAIIWKAVVETYEKAGLTEDDALVQARCARILRSSDWNVAKREPILWTPPKLKETTND